MWNENAPSCECSISAPNGKATSIDSFATVRARCPALNQVFLPDSIWTDFQSWWERSGHEAGHQSILRLAYERGYLDRVTSPIHRYLLTAATIRPNVRNQYIQDLREKWLGLKDPLERHKKWRIFQGHLVELQFAAWLERRSYTIDDLEALREGSDIEATSLDGSELRSS